MNQKVQINNRKYIHHSFSLPLILGMLDIDPTQLNTNFSHYAYGVFLLSLVALLCFINVLFYITIHYLIQVRNYELKYPKLNKIISSLCIYAGDVDDEAHLRVFTTACVFVRMTDTLGWVV